MKTFQQQINEIGKASGLRKEKRLDKQLEIKKNIDKELEDKLVSKGCELFYLFYTFEDCEGDMVTAGMNDFTSPLDGMGMIKLAMHSFDKLFYQDRDHILHGVLSPYFNDAKYILLAHLKLDDSFHIITNSTEYGFLGILSAFENREMQTCCDPFSLPF